MALLTWLGFAVVCAGTSGEPVWPAFYEGRCEVVYVGDL